MLAVGDGCIVDGSELLATAELATGLDVDSAST